MPKEKTSKERKRVVVEEVPTEKVSSKSLEESADKEIVEEVHNSTEPEPQISEEAAATETTEEPSVKDETKTPEFKSNLPKTEREPVQKPQSIALWIIIPGIFLLGALLGGIIFYQKGVNKSGVSTPVPTATPSETVDASPTPASKADLTKYSISVQNGSGIAGEASKVKELLVDAGFKVGSAGNAPTYDFTKTVVKAKEDVDTAFLAALSEALGKTYVVDKTQTLPESSKDEVVVIVGSTKAE